MLARPFEATEYHDFALARVEHDDTGKSDETLREHKEQSDKDLEKTRGIENSDGAQDIKIKDAVCAYNLPRLTSE